MIGGNIGDVDIANYFANTYQSIYSDSPANRTLHHEFEVDYERFKSIHGDESITPYLFTWSDMTDAALSIKLGKATSTFFKTEHT